MQIITKKNFISISCIIFTCLVVGKIILEAFMQNKFGNDQANLIAMLLLAYAGTFILSQHHRLDRFPLLVIFLIQYLIILSLAVLIVWVGSFLEPVAEGGYLDMIRSVSVPYIIFAIIYYISLYFENRKANKLIQTIRKQ